MCEIKRMRSINEAYDWLCEQDPGQKFTKGRLRRLVNEGVIPSVMVGHKLLIDQDALPGYLNAWMQSQSQGAANTEHGKPMNAVERREPGGKYGQIRMLN